MLSEQFKEHMALRKQVGAEIAENRRVYPPPSDVDGASHGQPGSMAEFDILGNYYNMSESEILGEKNKWLTDKVRSTKVSNAIGRGEMEPTEERFG